MTEFQGNEVPPVPPKKFADYVRCTQIKADAGPPARWVESSAGADQVYYVRFFEPGPAGDAEIRALIAQLQALLPVKE